MAWRGAGYWAPSGGSTGQACVWHVRAAALHKAAAVTIQLRRLQWYSGSQLDGSCAWRVLGTNSGSEDLHAFEPTMPRPVLMLRLWKVINVMMPFNGRESMTQWTADRALRPGAFLFGRLESHLERFRELRHRVLCRLRLDRLRSGAILTLRQRAHSPSRRE